MYKMAPSALDRTQIDRPLALIQTGFATRDDFKLDPALGTPPPTAAHPKHRDQIRYTEIIDSVTISLLLTRDF